MRDIEKELERAMIVAQIKQLLLDVEMWQNFILKWNGTLAQKNSELITSNIEYARVRINLLLVKIKNYIMEYEKC